jgi:predicted HD phosphohydrolase
MKIIDKIISNFINNKSLYIGEKVTISEHMIQSAMIAEKAKSPKNLICSCLLHDYGHFILENPDELVKKKIDGKHEDIGYEYLKKFFKKEVVEPIKYHVLAKRYLARGKKYFNSLSEASKISLKLQGGVLNKKESKEFEKKNFFKHSIKLRKFDEVAKRTDVKMKSIIEYKDLLTSQLL